MVHTEWARNLVLWHCKSGFQTTQWLTGSEWRHCPCVLSRISQATRTAAYYDRCHRNKYYLLFIRVMLNYNDQRTKLMGETSQSQQTQGIIVIRTYKSNSSSCSAHEICLSIDSYLSIFLSFYLSFYLSFFPSIDLSSIYLSVLPVWSLMLNDV